MSAPARLCAAVALMAAARLAAPLGAQDAPTPAAPASGGAQDAPASDAPRAETVYRLPDDATRLDLRDMDGDGALDLVEIAPGGIGLRFGRSNGRYPDEHDRLVRWPDFKLGWTLSDVDGDGADDIAMLVDGTTLRVWRSTREATEGEDVLTGLAGSLPRGIRRMDFLRDVDADGRADAIVPGTGRYLIHRGTGRGFAAEPVAVSFEAEVDLSVGDPDSLDGRFGQEVRVPLFRLEDVDGDGVVDLVSETEDELLVYLGGETLPSAPSWRLDVAALRREVNRPTRIDTSDLLAVAAPDVRWTIGDVDGVPPRDVVLQRGARFTVHRGGSRGLDPSRPDQVLKASGHVLHVLLRDADGDGRPDLQMLRAETISLGRVLRWLVIAGSLDFDVFTYRNEGGSFARSPSQRKRISLRVPALLGFASDAEEIEDELTRKLEWPAQAACLDDDGRADDVIEVRERHVALLRDRVPPDFRRGIEEQLHELGLEGLFEQELVALLDDVEDGGTKVVDLEQFPSLVPTPSHDLHLATQGVAADARYALPDAMVAIDSVRAIDLDGNGRSDVVTVGTDEHGGTLVHFLVLP